MPCPVSDTLGSALFLALLARAGGAATLWLDPPAHPRDVELRLSTVEGQQIRLSARLDGSDRPKDVAWRIGGLGRRFPVTLAAAAQAMLLMQALRSRRIELADPRARRTWSTWTSAWRPVQTHRAVLVDEGDGWVGETGPIVTELRGRFTRAEDGQRAVYLDLETRQSTSAVEGPVLGQPVKAHLFDPARQRPVVGFQSDPVCAAP